MRTLSIISFASLLILWGVYSYLKDNSLVTATHKTAKHDEKQIATTTEETNSEANEKERADLDKIGSVINEHNVDLDLATKDQIKIAKKVYDAKENLKEKQSLLEQSFLDRASSITDIKHLQSEITDLKNKLRTEAMNTEKWDPRFVYYLMMQENYTYQEINAIKSLNENGLNADEISYINEQIKEAAFLEKITAFKTQGEVGRAVASIKKVKEKDEFLDGTDEHTSMESKIIEMNYNHEDKEEMVYGNNQ